MSRHTRACSSPFRTPTHRRPDSRSPRGRALRVVDSVRRQAPNGLPCLLRLHDLLLEDDESVSDADASTIAWALDTTLRHTLTFVRLAVPDRVVRDSPDGVLLADLPDLRRSNLQTLLARALEPPATGLRTILSMFAGPLPLPVVGDVHVLARELVEGMTLGEVRRRAVHAP